MNTESSTFAGLPSLSGVSEVRYERYSFVKSVKLYATCAHGFNISQASSTNQLGRLNVQCVHAWFCGKSSIQKTFEVVQRTCLI